MEKDDQCAYCPFSNMPAHWYKLISLSFPPFSAVKILKFGTPQTIAIIVLKIEKFDVTLH